MDFIPGNEENTYRVIETREGEIRSTDSQLQIRNSNSFVSPAKLFEKFPKSEPIHSSPPSIVETSITKRIDRRMERLISR